MIKLRPYVILVVTSVLFSTNVVVRAQGTVVIKGINHTYRKRLFLAIDSWNKSFIAADNINLGKETLTSDSTFTIIIHNVKQPTQCFIRGLTLMSTYNLFITPGDTVTLVVEKVDSIQSKLFFVGKNAAQYNYDIDRSSAISGYNLRSAKSSTEFKSIADSMQTAANAVMRKYLSLPVSPEFKKFITLENRLSYYSTLAIAYGFQSSFKDTLKPERFINAADVPFNLLTDPALLYSRNCTLGLIGIVNLLNCKPGFKRSAKNMQLSYDTIDSYFTGKTREYLLADLISSYAHHAQTLITSDEFNDMWTHCNEKITDSYYKQWMLETKNYYIKTNSSFPQTALKSTLKGDDGKQVTMENILAKYKNKPVILDFWATWCGACKQEFIMDRDIVENLKKQGYQFVYISINKDTDFKQMQTDARKYNFSEDSYLLSNENTSPLKGFLGINLIPRYVLVGCDGKIKNLDMPNPSSQNAFTTLLPRFDLSPADKATATVTSTSTKTGQIPSLYSLISSPF